MFVGITTCVDYADKLARTIKQNAKFFKKIYVVTDPTDFDTFDAIKDYPQVELVLNADVHLRGADFNKSGLLVAAQHKAHQQFANDWIVLFDADTLLPDNFSEIVDAVELKKQTCYLMPRKIYLTEADLLKDSPDKTERAAGFFQLYFDKSKYYPSYSSTAAECDEFFEKKFGKNKQILAGYCKHLGYSGQDWNGRVTPLWE
jgi:hypothetical protein